MTSIHSLLGRAMVAIAALFVALPATSGEREGVGRRIGDLGSVRGVDDMIGSRGGRHGQGGGDWRNSACPTCLIQLPCP